MLHPLSIYIYIYIYIYSSGKKWTLKLCMYKTLSVSLVTYTCIQKIFCTLVTRLSTRQLSSTTTMVHTYRDCHKTYVLCTSGLDAQLCNELQVQYYYCKCNSNTIVIIQIFKTVIVILRVIPISNIYNVIVGLHNFQILLILWVPSTDVKGICKYRYWYQLVESF